MKRMKMTDVEQYVAMRAALAKEKATLEARLAAINRALDGAAGIPARSGRKPGPKPATKTGGRRGPRAKNSLTMKEAMIQALGDKSLTRTELVQAVEKLGYKFTASDPLNSLSSVLYSDKRFKNASGKFSVGK